MPASIKTVSRLSIVRATWARMMDNLETVLRESGMGLSDVVRLNYYTTDVDAFFGAMEVVAPKKASTSVV